MTDLSESWGPIQNIPQGLLGFFQLKNAGRNPEALTRTLQGVFDLRKWYLLNDTQESVTATRALAPTVIGPVGFTTPATGLRVPAEEWWYVHYYDVSANLAAVGEQLIYYPALIGPNFAWTHPLGTRGSQAGAAVARQEIAFATDFFAPAGCEFGIYSTVNEGAATIEIAGNVQYTRLPI